MTQVAPELGLEIFESGGSKTEKPDRFLRITSSTLNFGEKF